MRSPFTGLRFARMELDNFRVGTMIKLAIVAISLIPLIYGGLFLLAFLDPYGNLVNVPAAVVNLDAGAQIDGEDRNVGQELCDELEDSSKDAKPGQPTGYKWTFVDQDVADRGLNDATYYMEVVIPEDFTENIASADSDDPLQAQLQVYFNPSTNLIAQTVGSSMVTKIKGELNEKVGKEYLDQIFIKLEDASEKLQDAVDGSEELADGIGDASDGSEELADGIGDAHDGSSKITDGLTSLSSGADDLDAGAGKLASGTSELKSGTATLKKKTSVLPSKTKKLSTGAATLAKGTNTLAKGTKKLKKKTKALPSSTKKLADGSAQVASGASTLASGATQLKESTSALPSSTKQLADGAAALAAGLGAEDSTDASTLVGGSAQLQAGAKTLSSGLSDAQEGINTIANGDGTANNPGIAGIAKMLGSASSGDAADAVTALGKDAGTMAAAIGEVSSTLTAIAQDESVDAATRQKIAALLQGLQKTNETTGLSPAQAASSTTADIAAASKALESTASSLDRASKALGLYASNLDAIANGGTIVDASGATSQTTGLAGAVQGAETLAAGAGNLHTGLVTASQGATQLQEGLSALNTGASALVAGIDSLESGALALNSGAAQVADGNKQLASSSKTLYSGIKSLNSGAGKVNSGAGKVAKGAKKLSSSSGTLVSGIKKLDNGAGQVNSGAKELAAGTGKVSSGAYDLKQGSSDLTSGLSDAKSGADELSSGLKKASDGADELHDGIEDGQKEMADSVKNKDAKVDMMSAPVTANGENGTGESITQIANYGTGFAPYFIGLGMWVGALMVSFLIRSLNSRILMSSASSLAAVLASYIPMAIIGIVQAAFLLLAIQFGLGMEIKYPLAFYLFGVLTALCFASIIQFFRASLGTVGMVVIVVLLMLQLCTAAGTFPIESELPIFQALNPWLPMTYVVGGFRMAMAGLSLDYFWPNVAALVAFMCLFLVLTLLVARHNRRVSMTTLYPPIQLAS